MAETACLTEITQCLVIALQRHERHAAVVIRIRVLRLPLNRARIIIERLGVFLQVVVGTGAVDVIAAVIRRDADRFTVEFDRATVVTGFVISNRRIKRNVRIFLAQFLRATTSQCFVARINVLHFVVQALFFQHVEIVVIKVDVVIVERICLAVIVEDVRVLVLEKILRRPADRISFTKIRIQFDDTVCSRQRLRILLRLAMQQRLELPVINIGRFTRDRLIDILQCRQPIFLLVSIIRLAMQRTCRRWRDGFLRFNARRRRCKRNATRQ